MRRAGRLRLSGEAEAGVTSARAESGTIGLTAPDPRRGHLRACGERPARCSSLSPRLGSPPRVRRAAGSHRSRRARSGVTSARAESGAHRYTRSGSGWGHLRACGERRPARSGCSPDRGSPPRVRRAELTVPAFAVPPGVTSARAESGTQGRAEDRRQRGHLRACGERCTVTSPVTNFVGSPPRVRRAASVTHLPRARVGVTSARAESGLLTPTLTSPRGGHLRACGERANAPSKPPARMGSPPRVRRAAWTKTPRAVRGGVTSARAESGRGIQRARQEPGGHLRACGERHDRPPRDDVVVGSPPRVRRAGVEPEPGVTLVGVTSARAESGQRLAGVAGDPRGHLRACGERSHCSVGSATAQGSPPRVRRAGAVDGVPGALRGVTSARAHSGLRPVPRLPLQRGSPPRVRRAASDSSPAR